MAYITPNSTVRFHQNIPLDNTYDHTLYFSSLSEQETYFSYRNQSDPTQSRVKYQIDNYTYQRHTRDSIRVGLPIENIVNCSYMSFKNTSFENKWFYAFITDMEYVNNNTTIVYYEIDVMQTYVINDVTFDQCYIERQHTVSDEIGGNTIPENLELGQYIYDDWGIDNTTPGYMIVIAATFSGSYDSLEATWTFSEAPGSIVNSIYNGVYLNVFDPDVLGGIDSANSFLIQATRENKESGIVNVFMLPKMFFNYNAGTGQYVLNTSAKYTDRTLIKGNNWLIGSSAPKNKKLYTYPYSMLYVDNGQGNSAEYRWEYFSTNNAVLRTYYTGSVSPEMLLMPRNYNNITSNIDNVNERISLTNFPQCPYAIDSYLAWLAQNNTKLNIAFASTILNSLIGIGGAVGSAISGNIGAGVITGVGQITNGISKVANLLAEKHVASTMPSHAKGTESNSAMIAINNVGFRIYNVHVRPEYARIIDDYFTRYGYAIHQNAVPELCARTRFTYVKTVDCTINANMPNEYSQKIVSIMNNGITFWNDKQHIGNYEIANEVWPG